MCTVSVIPLNPIEDAIRIVCNRDELRTRAPALPPRAMSFGERRAIMPIDSTSGGTWIAVNDAGLVLTLLNYHPAGAPRAAAGDAQISRGMIIPRLLSLDCVEHATETALQQRPGEFQPFRLLILDAQSYAEIASDGLMLRSCRRPNDRQPLMFTSSGLGDDLVERPRRELFNQMLLLHSATPRMQDEFHRHSWADKRHLSVCMSRAEASTVSRTTIELADGEARMTYEPIADGRAGPGVSIQLQLRILQRA